ncbi:uncharacterized protein LOC129224333 [Uloborus diversus]|uniref:uncharacterized protein LOC129224333 n=1 Tax=Uloborus diversus TaxID=327109 RepID=UPI002409C72E|nr:uncharacterized protein LOC129224333 [Uloborus diversus]
MELHHHGVVLILFIFLFQHTVHCAEKLKGPPKISGSYMAYGEIVEPIADASGILPQVYFEESYNSITKNAAFTIKSMGINLTFVENFQTNQTYRYLNNTVCVLLTVSDWLTTDSAPSLLHYESGDGTVRFSLKQLFSLSDDFLKISNESASVRGIPARKWVYEMTEKKDQDDETTGVVKVEVEAYWSDGTWVTSDTAQIVPLAFVVTKLNTTKGQPHVKAHQQYISVFGFARDTYDHKVFQPFQGVHCENRQSTMEFPSINEWKAMALHSEFILPDYREIKYVDNWFDAQHKLLRMDSESIRDENPVFEAKERKYQSEITVAPLGVVFKVKYKKGLTNCEIEEIQNYKFDIQTLFNIKQTAAEWSLESLMGVKTTSYVYTGQTVKRNIPCHVFQGIRKDWPDPSANVTSLWEWCFNVNMTENDNVLFKDGEVGLINAQITITESNYPYFSKGYRLIHHFYHVNHIKNADIMESTEFSISRCYREDQKVALQFESIYRITDDNLRLVENATSDLVFLQKWKSIIYRYTEMPSYSLRVSNVESTVINKRLYVKFLILDVHEGLPEAVKKGQISAEEAEKNLRKNIDAGSVIIFYDFNNDGTFDKVNVKKESLRNQLNKTFKAHTLPPPPPPPSTTTSKIFTLRTPGPHHTDNPVTDDADATKTTKNKSTYSTPESSSKDDHGIITTTERTKNKKIKYTGHQKGTVAGVSIAMLLVGISIGSIGTFCKYNGLPAFLQRG